jgi:Ni/Co efflux regulator RcnB
MKTLTLAMLVALTPVIALADGDKKKFKARHGQDSRYERDDRRKHDRRDGFETRVQGCPPGLAKKNPPCIPPGQAKKMFRYHKGDRIRDGYDRVRDPWAYGLDRDETYYRVGDDFYRVNRETGEILDLLGALNRVLN